VPKGRARRSDNETFPPSSIFCKYFSPFFSLDPHLQPFANPSLTRIQVWIPQKSWNNSFFPNQLCKDSSHRSHLHKDEDALGLRLLDLPFILGIGIWVGSVLLGGLFAVKVDGEEIGQGCTFC
jgi:hypothetical protein